MTEPSLVLPQENLLRLVQILEDEIDAAYLTSPVPGIVVSQQHYEGWKACCRALRKVASKMPTGGIVVDATKFRLLSEAVAESPLALDRFNFKLRKQDNISDT